MKTKHYTLSMLMALALAFSFGCSQKFKDLEIIETNYGDGYLRGRVFITDTITQQLIGKPIGKVTVQLRDAALANQPDFLTSAITYDNGYFIFSNLSKNKQFEIQCDYTVNGANFSDSVNVYATNESAQLDLKFQPTKQPGIAFTISDGSGLGALKGTSICLFSSPSLFNANNCTGNNYSQTTNELGKAAFLNISKGTYYALTQTSVDNKSFIKKDTIVVDGTTQFKYYRLSPQVPITISYTLFDLNGSPLKDANVCLFTSEIFYARDTCDGANYTNTTNAEGKLSFSNLPPGKYFAYASLILNNNKIGYVARDTFILPGAQLQRQLFLRRKF